MAKEKQVGGIGNYYGALNVKREADKFYWSIENYDGFFWEEIPESLYNELLKFQRKRTVALKKLKAQ